MLDDVDFYSRVYPIVRRELRHFAQTARRLRTDPDDMSARLALLPTSNRLMAEAFAVCVADAPAARTATVQQFVDDLERLIAAAASSTDKAILQCSQDLHKHIQYFRDLRATDSSIGENHSAFRDLILNAVNIFSNTLFGRYKWRSADPRHATAFFDEKLAEQNASESARDLIKLSAETLDGWCSHAKAMMLYSTVREFKPSRAVEIGIYGGRSIVPIALGLRDNKFGKVIGIETWSTSAISKYQTSVANDLAWALADFSGVKETFLRFVLDHGLASVIKIVEGSSDRAHMLLDDDIDFVHIDGGHSVFGAAQDIANYVPKVVSGGVVVFDDIDWESTGPGLELLLDTCRLIHVVGNLDNPTVPGCAAFVKL